MIAFANSTLARILPVNEEKIRVAIAFTAKDQFSAFKEKYKLLKQQIFWSR